jgi:hypothetical protein
VACGQAAAEPADDVPGGVPVQQPALVRAGASGDGLGDPGFQPGQLLVAGRQRPGGDEDRAQVPQRLAVGQLVEGLVGKRPLAGAELAQDVGDGALAQPGQDGGRAFTARQAVMECPQIRADRAVRAG